MNVVWLKARRGIRNEHPVGKLVTIECASANSRNECLEEAVQLTLHCDQSIFALQSEGDVLATGRPKAEADAIRPEHGALPKGVRHVCHARHRKTYRRLSSRSSVSSKAGSDLVGVKRDDVKRCS